MIESRCSREKALVPSKASATRLVIVMNLKELLPYTLDTECNPVLQDNKQQWFTEQ